MHNIVANVFKVIMFSVISMLLLDTSLVVADTIAVHNKLLTYSGYLQEVVISNNCVPNALRPSIDEQLQSVLQESNLASELVTNLNDLSEANAVDYGTLVDIEVSVRMKPQKVYIGTHTGSNAGTLISKADDAVGYTLDYVYTVPALRYLK